MSFRIKKENSKKETAIYIVLLFAIFSYIFLTSISTLEFFRHTEADRTLISWEMSESGNLLIPTLLGSEILTKPPLFYIIQSVFISKFIFVNEFVARLPSAFFAIIFTLLHFIFLKKVGLKGKEAFWGTFICSSGALYFLLGTLAEIDFIFGFFCFVSFYFLYFYLKDSGKGSCVLSYVFAALAFLTKGPQIVVFFALGSLPFFLYDRIFLRKHSLKIKEYICDNIFGVLVFLVFILTWIVLLGSQVGFDELYVQFVDEVVNRAISEDSKKRGFYFYWIKSFDMIFPWSFFLVALFLFKIFGKIKLKNSISLLTFEQRHFLVFNIFYLIFGTFFMSLSAGKSSRYFFPLYLSLSNLCLFSFLILKKEELMGKILNFVKYILIAFALSPFALFFVKVKGLDLSTMLVPLVLLLVSLIFYVIVIDQKRKDILFFSGIFVFFSLHFTYLSIYLPLRNQKRSIKSVAYEIDSAMPRNLPVYTLEEYERWVNFYLKTLGRNSIRLTPDNKYLPVSFNGFSYLLINKKQESWRIKELSNAGYSPEVLGAYPLRGTDEELILLKVVSKAFVVFKPSKRFPVSPTKPWYEQS